MAKTKKQIQQLDETGKRNGDDRRSKAATSIAESSAPAKEQRKVKRRRQIDPTTCEREYSDQEIEFMQAMDEYKRASGRMFPTCSEILEVMMNLGYRQVAETQAIYNPKQSDSNAPSEEELDSIEELHI